MKWLAKDFTQYLLGESPHGNMLCELMGPLTGLDKEWISQGAAPDEINMTGFCFDWIETCKMYHPGSIYILAEPEKSAIVKETAEHIIYRDSWERLLKLVKGTAFLGLPVEYPVKDMESWLKYKKRFEFDKNQISNEEIEKAITMQKQGAVICAQIPGGYDLPREIMGDETLCMTYYDDPEMINDIMETITDSSFRHLEELSRKVQFDVLIVHEDMAGKGGPLAGPKQIKEFIKPYYRKIWDMLSSRGTRLFAQDSDGDMRPVIDSFIDCGVNVFFPNEPAADMDIVDLRKKYGKSIGLIGGIDKHVLRKDKKAILKELEYKMQPCMQNGGVIFALDHRIPNGTPLENYRYYVKTAREILGITGAEKGWSRILF